MKSLAERILDILLYLPVGTGIALSEEIPKLEDRGRQQVESLTINARAVGQFAVQVGSQQARTILPKALEELTGAIDSIVSKSPPQ
ncbi:MAG: hypothetical protein ACYDGY_10165, partial [Acidimicrobiales bacterium]